MATETSTARCPGCAAIVVPGAAWCGLCFSPLTGAPAFGAVPAAPTAFGAVPAAPTAFGAVPAAPTAFGAPTAAAAAGAAPMATTGTPVDVPTGFRAGGTQPARPRIYTDSRWKSGSTTFGPVGRVILTICLFLPYPLFLLAFPFGLVGAGIWTLIIVPRSLRDIWALSRRHHLPPQA